MPMWLQLWSMMFAERPTACDPVASWRDQRLPLGMSGRGTCCDGLPLQAGVLVCFLASLPVCLDIVYVDAQ